MQRSGYWAIAYQVLPLVVRVLSPPERLLL